ncbi:metalloregulator ArsR/SmtB family transcription factor [Klebsiella pneumoniae]|nr:metalloregulator ArsR/SmtB family transcription factor [Klebsiella pneumoniae]MEA4485755.1 metalloregulator ArsR/SmtB family transcription factor [Klebsiella pneumoniae]
MLSLTDNEIIQRQYKMIPLSAFYRLLSDESRLNILLLLRESGELCVCHISEELGLPQPAISRNLAMLKASRILRDRRNGKWVYYRLNEMLPVWMNDILEITQRQAKTVPGRKRPLKINQP